MEDIYSYLPLFRKLQGGTATAEERAFYMRNYADRIEKKLNKPYFDFNDDEILEYQIAEENSKSGEMNLTDRIGYDCKECKNRGYFAVRYNGGYAERDCKCLNIRRVLNQVKWSGLGDIFKKCTFERFDCKFQWQGLVKDKAMEFLNSSSNCFFIGGTSGSGKSHICTAIVGQFLKQGKDINYVQWLDLVDDLNNTRYRQIEKYDEIMNRIKTAEVLYIDDFLKGDNTVKPSAADIKLAYKIINARYVISRASDYKRYITVISSEWKLPLVNGFDRATGGRIAELADGFIVRLDGEEKNQRLAVGV